MNVIDALPNNLKKKGRTPGEQDNLAKPRGRPKGAVNKKFTMATYAERPTALLPKTEVQRIKELKDLLINSAGSNVVHKAIEIAMNDEHPAQAAMLKLCMDRMLPVSLFEKEGKQRNAVTINITGIGGVEIEPLQDVTDVETKNV
jgi:hypothetical protein